MRAITGDAKGSDVLVGNFDSATSTAWGTTMYSRPSTASFAFRQRARRTWVDVASSSVALGSLNVANFGLARVDGAAKASVVRQ
jgi:hypothetical protein